jgi:hypothetical protein
VPSTRPVAKRDVPVAAPIFGVVREGDANGAHPLHFAKNPAAVLGTPLSVSTQFVLVTTQLNKSVVAGIAVGSCKLHDVCVAAGEPIMLAVFAGRDGSVVLPGRETIPG